MIYISRLTIYSDIDLYDIDINIVTYG